MTRTTKLIQFSAAVAIALTMFLFAWAVQGVAGRPDPTWQYKVEDDAPVCWQARDGVFCGPLSWADGHVIVEPWNK